MNIRILTQGANVHVATYLTNSDTLEIVRNVGSGDTVQCTGQCSDCSYQYRMQVCSSLYVSLLDSVTSKGANVIFQIYSRNNYNKMPWNLAGTVMYFTASVKASF